MKQCRKCLEYLSKDKFYKGKNKDGLTSYCKICFKSCQKYRPDYYKKWVENNRLKVKDYHKTYYQNNKEIFAFRSKERTKTDIWRKYHNAYEKKKYADRNIEVMARLAMRHLFQKNKLNRPLCQLCNDTGKEFHHFDYSKPYEVFSLCIACHRDVHRKRKSLDNIQPLDYNKYNRVSY